jgi:outer membrane protein
MKRYFLLCMLGIPLSMQAQTTSLSLQEAITLGLQQRYDIQADKYDLDIAATDVQTQKKAWLPDLRVNGDIRYNAQYQASYIPAGFIGTKPELVALSARNATVFGLELDQAIYDPEIRNNIRIAQNNFALQKEKQRAAAIVIKTSISEDYLDVLLKQLQHKIAVQDEARYLDYFNLATGKYEHGALLEKDYLRAKLDHENAVLQTQTAEQKEVIALQRLKHAVNMPATDSLTLKDSLSSPSLFGAKEGGTRTELLQLQLEQEDNRLQLQKAKQQLLPTLSFTGNYSQQFLYDNFNYTKGEWWTPFSYLGLKISVPISSHYKTTTRSYALRVKQTELTLQQQTADIDHEVRETNMQLDNAQKNMLVTKSNYDLSVSIYQQQQQQYALGAFQYSELLDTERSIANAEANYIQAVYDYMVAKLQYLKASDKL